MTPKGRTERVAEYIREEIAKLLIDGIKDPRLGFVSVMGVKMSKDLRYANVYVSLYGDEKQRKSSLIALQNSAGWVKAMISQNLHMRYIPDIRFFPDDSLDRVYAMEEVFSMIHQKKIEQPFIKLDLSTVIEEIKSSDRIMITTHERPDGDALGSLIGLWYWLESQGKSQIIPLIEKPVPKMYSFLPRANKIYHLEDEKLPRIDVDTVIIVDVASLERIGGVSEKVQAKHKVLVIDHHETLENNGLMGFADPSYAACGEIIAELFINTETPFTEESATCLYVAQATDTGGYRFSNTNARSHRIASSLMEAKFDLEEINAKIFDTISIPQFELLKRMLSRTKLEVQGKVSYSYLTQKDFQQIGATIEDCHNLVNTLRDIEGVSIGILFTEVNSEKIKISIRSRKHFHAGEFLTKYGGGGHRCAAGGTLNLPLEKAIEEILQAIEREMNG
ncbi:MAG: 30S ribosome-binding factor RbfA [Candidatus Hydrogenedens sp.]